MVTVQIDNLPAVAIPFAPATVFTDVNIDQNVISNYKFFDSGTLDDGPHTLTITSAADNTLFLDYMLLQPSRAFFANPKNGTAPPTTSMLSGSSKPQTGAVVGVVLGSLAIIIASIGLIFFLRRRRYGKRRAPTHYTAAEYSNQPLLGMIEFPRLNSFIG